MLYSKLKLAARCAKCLFFFKHLWMFLSFQTIFWRLLSHKWISWKKCSKSKNAWKLTFYSFGAQKPRKNVILSQLREVFSKNWFMLWPIAFRRAIYMYVRDFSPERLARSCFFLSKIALTFWLSSTAQKIA